MNSTAGEAQPLVQGVDCCVSTSMAQSQAQDADWEDDSFLRLYLTTLAGTVIQLQVPFSIHHTWEMLEES